MCSFFIRSRGPGICVVSLGLEIEEQDTTMPPSKQEGTAAAAAAEQIGSMTLGESAGKKENETEPTTKNGTPSKMCSACGKKSNTLKKCNGCKCVWYCDKKCQNKNRKEHKIECRRIKKELDERGGKLDVGTELDVGPLGKLPPREECPICMRVLPRHPMLSTYADCCGKFLCGGCNFQHQIKQREGGEKLSACAFCRTTLPKSDEEILARTHKRVELKDPNALLNMALDYGDGGHGLPVDQAKCIELLLESADLGCPGAQRQLGNYHHEGEMGLEQNKEKARKYFEKAAEGGHLLARHNLAFTANENGDRVAAMRHWRLSASGGYRKSMGALIECFEGGLLRHDDLAESVQAMYLARAEMKSEDRDQYIAHLKRTGEYEARFDD